MFSIGDKIAYPMHGAGVIESIEEKEILGKKQHYYVMKMPVGNMKVMIPTKNVKGIGLRDIIDDEGVKKVFDILHKNDINVSNNWNKRYRENMSKIKSGNIFEVARVVRTLMLRDNRKGLSTGERKMFNNAKQILVSELVLAKNLESEQVEVMISNLSKV